MRLLIKEARLMLVLFLKPFRSDLTNNLHHHRKREKVIGL